ncbi:hypothetical protein L6452_42821 [Arctium lappa]|uniref:Uncharacterized protein n=1 Tax=Arctium lappa TaxID=4217 RepID=A0ACB8XJJ9_ARCLA|nr:hypothetical protein L6452_42821 [Arctium lappa]
MVGQNQSPSSPPCVISLDSRRNQSLQSHNKAISHNQGNRRSSERETRLPPPLVSSRSPPTLEYSTPGLVWISSRFAPEPVRRSSRTPSYATITQIFAGVRQSRSSHLPSSERQITTPSR